MPVSGFIVIEIHMRIQILTVQILMRPTAEHGRIKEQVRDAGDLADEVQKGLRLDQIVQLPVHRRDGTDLWISGFSPHSAVDFVSCQPDVERWKVRQELICKGLREERVDQNMPERL